MFYQDDDQLYDEIKQSSDAVTRMADAVETEVAAFTGHAFEGSVARTNPDYMENHSYEYISLMLPRIFFDNPRVVTRTTQGEYQEIAMGIQLAMNQLIRKTNFQSAMQRMATDFLFSFGVSQTMMEPAPGYEALYAHDPHNDDIPFWPKVRRVSLRRYFRDTLAEHWSEAQFFGNWQIANKQTLLAKAQNIELGWDRSAIDKMAEDDDAGGGTLHRRHSAARSRKEIKYAECWIPDLLRDEDNDEDKNPETGYHGTIMTIGLSHDDNRAMQLRKPRPFFGPPQGPFHEVGGYCVPDDSFLLGPIMATRGQSAELNKLVRGAVDSANRYKRLVLVDSSSKELAKHLTDKPHDFIVPIKGLKKDEIIVIEIGGITQQMVALIADARDRLDRISGLSDAMRGNPQQGIKATADAIAAESSQTRVEHLKQNFAKGVQSVLQAMAWYAATDSRFKIMLGQEAQERLEELGLWEPGSAGVTFKGSGAMDPKLWQAIDMEIEPMSMERTTSALNQRRQLEALSLVVQLLPVMAQFPTQVDWRALVQKIGDAMNMPDLAKIIVAADQSQGGGLTSGNPIQNTATPAGVPQPVESLGFGGQAFAA